MKGLLSALALCCVLLAACGDQSSGGPSGGSDAAEDEVRLDQLSPGEIKREREKAGRSGASPQVVEAPRPDPLDADAASEEEPPERIQREDAALRRELDHLKSLEREQKRVKRALAKAGLDAPLQLGAGGLAWPVGGSVVSPFGQRWGRLHAGIDIASPAGTVIRAAADGRVVIAGPTGGYGNYVCVQHTERLSTCYAHLSRFLTRRGKAVAQGEPLGLVGCTGHCFGDHLHFETRVDGQPVDPRRYY